MTAGRTIVFHIGLERTGTTALQRFCVRNRTALAESSILYPTSGRAFRGLNHLGLAAVYMPPAHRDHFVNGRDGRDEVVASLKREIAASGAATILLSCEHFSSRFRRAQIDALAADFAEYECRVAVTLRDHLTRFYSIYATHIASGGRAGVDEFARWVLAEDSVELRYADILVSWRGAFAADAVAAFLFDGGDPVSAFFRPGGPMPAPGLLRLSRPTGRLDLFGAATNRALGPRETALLRAANRAAARLLPSTAPWAMALKHPIWVAARSAIHLGGALGGGGRDDDEAWGLAPGLRIRLAALAQADARRLDEQFGIRFREPGSGPEPVRNLATAPERR